MNGVKLALCIFPLTLAVPALAQQGTDAEDLRLRLEKLEQRVDAAGERLDNFARIPGSAPGDQAGLGKTSIGGYGELHYNNLDNGSGTEKKEMDFHRFVLFLGHQFSPDIRLFSELELEHALAGEGKPGEVELEQAYVEFDLTDSTHAKGGVFLLPIGLLNETHEPPTFYGVERNPVETKIIPSTWWEGGALLGGTLMPGLGYDLAVHSGLNVSDYNIRGGRQKVAKAQAEALAYTGRLRWTGVPGLELGVALNHQTDITQGNEARAISGRLLEAHAVFQSGPLGLRTLYAKWDFEDHGAAQGKDEQHGWYVEPSLKLTRQIGLFARYNVWDTQAGDRPDSEFTQTDFGINYWPHDNLVLKADYQKQDAPKGQAAWDGFNLGIGYQF